MQQQLYVVGDIFSTSSPSFQNLFGVHSSCRFIKTPGLQNEKTIVTIRDLSMVGKVFENFSSKTLQNKLAATTLMIKKKSEKDSITGMRK